MKSIILYYLISLISLSNACNRVLEKIPFSKIFSSNGRNSIYYSNKDKLFAFPLELNLDIEIKESFHASLFLSETNSRFESKAKNSLKVDINSSKEDKSKIHLKIKKTFKPLKKNIIAPDAKNDLTEIVLPIKERIIDSNEIQSKEKNLKNSFIKLRFFIEKNEIKILYSENVIYSEYIDITKYFGNYTYIFLESSKDKRKGEIKDFYICHSKIGPKFLRNLEENSSTQLYSIEIDKYSLKTSPNILREGNVQIIPSVILIPKDKNGDFPSNILNYTSRELKNLFNITHSKNGTLFYQVVIISREKLIINLETEIPGVIYINSKYFMNGITYIINIIKTELVISETIIVIDEESLISGVNSKIKIIPRSKYQVPLDFIDESDIEKFHLSITLPNKTVINVEKGEFDLKEKAILFNPNLNFKGEASIEVKYGDTPISCKNCNINVRDIDWEQTKIEYSDKINTGDISYLTIYPKDENGNELSARTILQKIGIKCTFANNSLEIISVINEKNNTIEISTKEAIQSIGILTWEITSDNNIFVYNINIEEKVYKYLMNIYLNAKNEEIRDNTTKITLDVKLDFIMTFELVDSFYRKLENISSTKVTEVQMFGNYMTPLNLEIIRDKNIFNFSLSDNDKKEFNNLVSGDNYELKIKLEENDIINNIYFTIILISSENDTEYGNGDYNISHFTFEPNNDLYELFGGETFQFYLYVRTSQDLLYHKDLNINEHLKFNQTFDDDTFSFKASNIDSKLGIFLIELYSTKISNNSKELEMTFDGQKFGKKIMFIIKEDNRIPNPNYTEIIYFTSEITEDIQPIIIMLKIRDNNLNYISRKDIAYKKQLFIINENENEKPEQNIDIDTDSQIYILIFYSHHYNSSLNLSIYFNNSNGLILLKNNIIVQLNIKNFLEDEDLVTDTIYTPGIGFLYKNNKYINVIFTIDDNSTSDINEDIEAEYYFLLYIKDIHYEKSENNTKLEYYTGYLAILQLINRNSTNDEDKYLIYDKKLIDIYRRMRNNSDEIITLNNQLNDSTGFIKFEFYDNGEIKQIYYPKIDTFNYKSIDYIKESIELIIPKISSDLYSIDIYSQFNDIQEDFLEDNSFEGRRRLRAKNSKKIKKDKNKIKKIRYRVLEEDPLYNTINEKFIEDEILPIEDKEDYEFREIIDNGDNTKNITLLYIGDLDNEQSKVTGSLDNKTVLTLLDNDGKILEIFKRQESHLITGVRDPYLDEYIYNNTYNEDSHFKKDTFLAENETQIINEENPIRLKSLDAINYNYVVLIDDFFDDDGKLIEYFNNTIYEVYNETIYQNYVLQEMGPNFLDKINAVNMSISIDEIKEEENTKLRNLDSDRYPYYGQRIINNVKDVYEKHFLGITMRTLIETSLYPDTGINLVETKMIFGAMQRTIDSETTFTNNHIIIKNKNTLSNDVINFLDIYINEIRDYTDQIEDEYNKLHEVLIKEKPYTTTYDNLLDDYSNQFEHNTDGIVSLIDMYYKFFYKADESDHTSALNIDNNVRYKFRNIYEEHLTKLHDYYNSIIKFNNDIFNFVKNTYEKNTNISLDIIQEITDDIDRLNDDIDDNIRNYLSAYNDELSNFENYENTSFIYLLNNLSDQYNSKVQIIIDTLEFFNFSKPKLREKRSTFINYVKDSVNKRKNNLLKEFKVLKNFKKYFTIKFREYFFKGINNYLKNYLKQKLSILDINIQNLKDYLEPIYNSSHDFLFDFNKEFSKEIYHTLNNIELNNYNNTKEVLFEIIKNIINEYISITKDSSNLEQYKKEIEENLLTYKNTVLKYISNFEINELIPNYIPSNNFWEKFNNSLKKINDSFSAYEKYKYFLQYPEELDYIINTLNSFKNEIQTIIKVINKYSKEVIFSRINLIYNNFIEYILKFVDLDKNYLIYNIEKIENLSNYINITHEKLQLKDYFPNQTNIDNFTKTFSKEDLKNFSFINEDTSNKLSSIIQNNIESINNTREVIYNYYHGINCEINGCSTTNEISDENLKNRFMRIRLEMLTSFMSLFTEKFYEIFDEEDFNTMLISGINIEEIMESYYISELNQNALEYIQPDIDNMHNLINKDISMIKYIYNDLNYSEFIYSYEQILNNEEQLFINLTKAQYFRYNKTIYSLIKQYEDILYQYITNYNYTIDSFDIFKNYFNNYYSNISNKFESIKTKIKIFQGIYTNESIQKDNINKHFRENLTNLMKERNDSLIELLNNSDFEFKILDKNFKLSEYLLEQISENDTKNLNEINNKTNEDCLKFVNYIEELINDFEKPINSFKNITDEFLINFEKGDNLTNEEKEEVKAAYINEFNLKNNNTYRKCWSLRGKFANEVANEDKINFNNYLSYIYKIIAISECEENKTYDCPYDILDLEEVEYNNETELYKFCLENNKIYGKKQSIFYDMEDFDLEGLNKINNKFMNVLDRLYSFDTLLTDYIYQRYGLSLYRYFDNNTLNIEESVIQIRDTINESLISIQEKYDNYIIDNLSSKLRNILEFYDYKIYLKANDSYCLFVNMKNRFFVNYYFEQYKLFENLFKDILKKMTSTNPSHKSVLLDVFSEIEEQHNKYSLNIWKEDIDDEIFHYYSDTFSNIFIESFFNYTKDKVNKENNMTFLKDNLENILNKTESDPQYIEVKTEIIGFFTAFKLVGFGNNIYLDENTKKQIDISQLKQIINTINSIDFFLQRRELLDDYNEKKKEYLKEINTTYQYEVFSVKNITDPLINNSIYIAFDVNDGIDELINQINNISEISFDSNKVPNFFSIAYNKSIDYYKDIYNKTKEFYQNIIKIIRNVSLFYNTDFIEEKFSDLVGYGMIEGTIHIDPICNNDGCPYSIDLLKKKEELINNSTRKLSEIPFKKDIEEIMNELKDLRDINKDYSDYLYENLTNSKRKLSSDYNYDLYNNYDSHSPERSKKQVEVVISYLKRAIDELNEKFYYYGKSIQMEIANKFNNELGILQSKYLKYLTIFEKLFTSEDYSSAESIFTNQMFNLDYYVGNATGSIISLTEKYLESINNFYFSHKITGERVTKKIYNYYDGLHLLIESKYIKVEEEDYNKVISDEEKKIKLQAQYQLVSNVMFETLKLQTDVDTEIDSESKSIFGLLDDYNEIPNFIESRRLADSLSDGSIIDMFNKVTYMLRINQNQIEKVKENAEKVNKKNGFMIKGDSIIYKLESLNTKFEAEIKINWKNLLESTIGLSFFYNYNNETSTRFTHPFILPQFPLLQLRVGFIITFKYEIIIGSTLTFQYTEKDGAQFDFRFIVQFILDFTIDAVAEGGIFGGISNVYGGITGTLLNAKAEFKITIYLSFNEIDFGITINIYSLKFRVYVEGDINIFVLKGKVVIYEQYFGLTNPLLNLYYYVKFNSEGQKICKMKGLSY